MGGKKIRKEVFKMTLEIENVKKLRALKEELEKVKEEWEREKKKAFSQLIQKVKQILEDTQLDEEKKCKKIFEECVIFYDAIIY
jgi:hypothetical protein